MPSWDELENVYGASLEGLDEQQRELMRSRAVAQPFGTYTQPLRLGNAAREALPKLLITNSFPLAQVKELIASEHPWFRELAGPEWRFLELPTGHWPMFSRPDDLAALLIEIPPMGSTRYRVGCHPTSENRTTRQSDDASSTVAHPPKLCAAYGARYPTVMSQSPGKVGKIVPGRWARGIATRAPTLFTEVPRRSLSEVRRFISASGAVARRACAWRSGDAPHRLLARGPHAPRPYPGNLARAGGGG